MSTKKGRWVKYGRAGKSSAPGGYKGYVYERAAPAPYPKTSQQKKAATCARTVVKKGMSLSAIHQAMADCM